MQSPAAGRNAKAGGAGTWDWEEVVPDAIGGKWDQSWRVQGLGEELGCILSVGKGFKQETDLVCFTAGFIFCSLIAVATVWKTNGVGDSGRSQQWKRGLVRMLGPNPGERRGWLGWRKWQWTWRKVHW